MNEYRESVNYRRGKEKLKFHLMELSIVFSDFKKQGIDVDQVIAEIQQENEQTNLFFDQSNHLHLERSL